MLCCFVKHLDWQLSKKVEKPRLQAKLATTSLKAITKPSWSNVFSFVCVFYFCRQLVTVYSERSYPYHGSAMNGPISHTVLLKYFGSPYHVILLCL